MLIFCILSRRILGHTLIVILVVMLLKLSQVWDFWKVFFGNYVASSVLLCAFQGNCKDCRSMSSGLTGTSPSHKKEVKGKVIDSRN